MVLEARTPAQGALLQEVIDVAVILNALRALRIAPNAPMAPEAALDAVPGNTELKGNN